MNPETIGERIYRIRQERGMTMRALGEPGISYAFISRIESGERTPSMKALRRIAPKLGVSVAYLESGREEITLPVAEIDAVLTQWLGLRWSELTEAEREAALAEARREAFYALAACAYAGASARDGGCVVSDLDGLERLLYAIETAERSALWIYVTLDEKGAPINAGGVWPNGEDALLAAASEDKSAGFHVPIPLFLVEPPRSGPSDVEVLLAGLGVGSLAELRSLVKVGRLGTGTWNPALERREPAAQEWPHDG